METRKVTMTITTAGGNASKGTRTYRVTIPNLWAQDWDIIKEDRDIMIIKDGERIIIERVRKMEVYKIDKDELLDAVREYGGSLRLVSTKARHTSTVWRITLKRPVSKYRSLMTKSFQRWETKRSLPSCKTTLILFPQRVDIK